MSWELVVTIVGSVLGATGLFNFLQFLIKRKDDSAAGNKKMAEELDSIKKEIKGIIELIDRNEAINARIRILQAADGIRHSTIKHSEEYFDQLNDDITRYETYCNEHEGFKNNKAAHAIKYVNETYHAALTNNDFL